jgi:hypothetical protein
MNKHLRDKESLPTITAKFDKLDREDKFRPESPPNGGLSAF